MGTETLEEKRRRLYSALSHEELVDEIMKRDTADNTSLRDIAKSSINLGHNRTFECTYRNL